MPDWLTIINLGYVTMIYKKVSCVDSNVQCQRHRPDSCPANKIFEENKYQIVFKNQLRSNIESNGAKYVFMTKSQDYPKNWKKFPKIKRIGKTENGKNLI